MVRLRVLLVVAALAALAGQAPAAVAAAPSPIADCSSSGALIHRYSAAELQQALRTMPADVKEYTNCYDVIQRALLAQVSGHRADESGASGGSGGSFLPTPVIVLLVLLVLAAVAFGAVALRRRSAGSGGRS